MAKPLLGVLLAVVAVAAVGLARSDAGPSATAVPVVAAPSPLLGFVAAGGGQALVRVDPETLRPRRGRRVGAGTQGCASRAGGSACWSAPPWSYSPDGSRLALARNAEGVVRSLRIVDVAALRVAGDIAIGGGAVGLVAWPGRRRLLAVQEVCCREREQLVVVDLAARRVVARRALGGTVLRVARAPRELVLLVAPARALGAARLAVVDARGAIRFAALPRTPAGQQLLDRSRLRFRHSVPGLAVDPDGRRAFVVGPGLVADVDLARLAVSYHGLARRVSLLGRLRAWLDPAAYAKGSSGPTRSAHWLGGGVLAVTGSDEARRDGGAALRAAGLSLVDTRGWSVRTLDRRATDVRVAGDLLLATGWSSAGAIGVTAYGLDGGRRWQRFDGHRAWIERVHAGRVYVQLIPARGPGESLRVLDLATGAAAPGRARPLPRLLLEPESSWWDAP